MKLIDCFIPFFALVRHFQSAPEGDAAALSARLDGMVNDARNRSRDAGYADADIDEALFAAAAWADETLIAASGWSSAADWQRHLLQRRYFSVSNAGVAFFERLGRLAPERTAVREVYGLALGLGFAGRYGYDRNQKALTDIKRATLTALLEGDDVLPGDGNLLMFPDGYGALLDEAGARKGGARRPSLSRFTWGALLAPLAMLLAMYGIYHFTVWRLVVSLLPQIHL
ncbi:MAG: DotU/TssL family secretion system protein [Bordetella sp.]|uniref:DotU/TssL family secretion system protein n=1 Tax=Bordetella sp. TaxID=28081 RepID=UPI003F7BF386